MPWELKKAYDLKGFKTWRDYNSLPDIYDPQWMHTGHAHYTWAYVTPIHILKRPNSFMYIDIIDP